MSAASIEDIRTWLERGRLEAARWMLVICDTFDHSDFPVYYLESDREGCLEHIRKAQANVNMERLMEVYDLARPIEAQMAEDRAMHPPGEIPPPPPVKPKDPAIQVWDGRG